VALIVKDFPGGGKRDHGEPQAFSINDGLCFKHRWADYSRQVKVV
jgi:hypothetical protein